MKRLFLAIKIDPAEEFYRIYYSFRTKLKNEKINWVEPHNMHLTIKFFGETHEHQIMTITNAVSAALTITVPFKISMKNCGVFGSSYHPKVIWFGFENTEPLVKIYSLIKQELLRAGFEYDRQNFVPHLTIARIKNLEQKAALKSMVTGFSGKDIQDVNVDKLLLFESILHPKGPEYIPVWEFQLLK